MRRLLPVFLAFWIFGFSVLNSYEVVHANAAVFTLAGTSAETISAAAGASVVAPYVIAGVLLAAGGAYIANEYGDEIKQYATKVYSDMSAAAKQSFQAAYAEAIQAGKNTITLSSDFINELRSNSQTIADWLKSKLNTAESVSITTDAWGLDTASYYFGWKFVANVAAGYTLYVNGQQAKSVAYTRNTDYTPARISVWWVDMSDVIHDVIFEQPLTDSMFKNKSYYDSLSKIMQLLTYVGLTVGISKTGLESAGYDAKTVIDNALDDVASHPVGIPNLGVKSLDGQSLTYDPTAQKWKTGAGTVVEDVVADFPMPVPGADATWGNPAIPLSQVVVGDIPFLDVGETTAPPVEEGVVKNPFGLPIAALSGLLCILKSVILYLIRLFQFIVSIPNAPAISFGNAAFEWFRTARIMGVQIYSVISSLASIGLSVAVYKAVRRVIP